MFLLSLVCSVMNYSDFGLQYFVFLYAQQLG